MVLTRFLVSPDANMSLEIIAHHKGSAVHSNFTYVPGSKKPTDTQSLEPTKKRTLAHHRGEQAESFALQLYMCTWESKAHTNRRGQTLGFVLVSSTALVSQRMLFQSVFTSRVPFVGCKKRKGRSSRKCQTFQSCSFDAKTFLWRHDLKL